MLYDNVEQLTDSQVVQLHALYQGEWWTAGRSLDEVRQMLAGSAHIYGICEARSGRLVGFARVLSDSVFKALIFDVIVDPESRGQKIGQKLIKNVVSDPRLARVKHFELYCRPDLERYYENLGFTADVEGVRLMRCTPE